MIIRPGLEHPLVVSLCSESEILNLLQQSTGNNQKMVESIYGLKRKLSVKLYQLIWEPLEPALKGVKSVYYAPSGILHKISFSALGIREDVLLCEKYNLNQLSGTTALRDRKPAEFSESDSFFMMGGVNYTISDSAYKIWEYLPGSLAETQQIHELLKNEKLEVKYCSSDLATETILKEEIENFSFVHIATHGFFFPDPESIDASIVPETEQNKELSFRGRTNYADWSFINNKNPLMRSGLVLAGANEVWSRNPLEAGEDGILTALEVASLDCRNTNLVVLSACETGLGDIVGSEGVYGLQRAFKIAGTRFIIMSLWQVPDLETAEFMINFYRNLLSVKDIRLAFNKTRQLMSQKYDPYYWAAFVLIE
ncbi:MAG: CHAT domain-containing protein [Crocinitomicaceae bacterium]|nr:CHAT domain-containing protein [Crocinitomicaceae bacterium]